MSFYADDAIKLRRLELQLDYQETFAPERRRRVTTLSTGRLWMLYDEGLLAWLRVSHQPTIEQWPAFFRNPLTWRSRRSDEVHAS